MWITVLATIHNAGQPGRSADALPLRMIGINLDVTSERELQIHLLIHRATVSADGCECLRKCVAPIHCLSVPAGCPTVRLRTRIMSGALFSMFCISSGMATSSQRRPRRSVLGVHCGLIEQPLHELALDKDSTAQVQRAVAADNDSVDVQNFTVQLTLARPALLRTQAALA